MTEVYLLFMHSSLQVFISFNKFMQRGDPIIPILNEQINNFLKRLLCKFVTIAAIKSAATVETTCYERESQLPSKLMIVM